MNHFPRAITFLEKITIFPHSTDANLAFPVCRRKAICSWVFKSEPMPIDQEPGRGAAAEAREAQGCSWEAISPSAATQVAEVPPLRPRGGTFGRPRAPGRRLVFLTHR